MFYSMVEKQKSSQPLRMQSQSRQPPPMQSFPAQQYPSANYQRQMSGQPIPPQMYPLDDHQRQMSGHPQQYSFADHQRQGPGLSFGASRSYAAQPNTIDLTSDEKKFTVKVHHTGYKGYLYVTDQSSIWATRGGRFVQFRRVPEEEVRQIVAATYVGKSNTELRMLKKELADAKQIMQELRAAKEEVREGRGRMA